MLPTGTNTSRGGDVGAAVKDEIILLAISAHRSQFTTYSCTPQDVHYCNTVSKTEAMPQASQHNY